eukprot:g1742.t1
MEAMNGIFDLTSTGDASGSATSSNQVERKVAPVSKMNLPRPPEQYLASRNVWSPRNNGNSGARRAGGQKKRKRYKKNGRKLVQRSSSPRHNGSSNNRNKLEDELLENFDERLKLEVKKMHRQMREKEKRMKREMQRRLAKEKLRLRKKLDLAIRAQGKKLRKKDWLRIGEGGGEGDLNNNETDSQGVEFTVEGESKLPAISSPRDRSQQNPTQNQGNENARAEEQKRKENNHRSRLSSLKDPGNLHQVETLAEIKSYLLKHVPEGMRNNYNDCLSQLKYKFYQKGQRAIQNHFRGWDIDQDGIIDQNEFRRAMDSLNLKVNAKTLDLFCLLVDKDKNGVIDYEEFTHSIRYGKMVYLPGDKNYKGKSFNPEEPLGDSVLVKELPYGVMSDAPKNLEKFDKIMNKRFASLKDSFVQYDKDQSGDIDRKEFHNALLTSLPKAHLTKLEINELFDDADKDRGGSINYEEFIGSFATGKRCIPEFMKPKRLRRSQNGHPWQWDTSEWIQKFKVPFRIKDTKSLDRDAVLYHCGVLNKYLPPKAFDTEDIRKKNHISKEGKRRMVKKELMTLPIVNKEKKTRRKGRKMVQHDTCSTLTLC